MLTLKRFKTMTESYGADLLRWPERQRAEAERLLEHSAKARALLADERRLDEALAAVSARQGADQQRNDDQAAALARLRSGVAVRIAATSTRSRLSLFERALSIVAPRTLFTPSGWAGLATAAGVAVLAGLAMGSLYTPPGSSDALFALLQAAPIDNLGGLM
jgi:hypothetical protein